MFLTYKFLIHYTLSSIVCPLSKIRNDVLRFAYISLSSWKMYMSTAGDKSMEKPFCYALEYSVQESYLKEAH